MKILVITFFHVPWVGTDQNGMSRRLTCFLRALHRIGTDITLLHIVPEAMRDAAGPLDELSRSQSAFWGVPVRIAVECRRARAETAWGHYGAGVLDAYAQPDWFPYSGPELAAAVGRHLDAGPDLVFAYGLPAMAALLRSGRRPTRLMFDMTDIEHKVWVRRAFSKPLYPGKLAKLLQVPALVWFERRAVQASKLALICSSTDQAYLRRLGFGGKVQVVPNALPLPLAPPGVVAAPTLLFLGDMGYPPNMLGAERMARRILPLIQASVPDARLLVAGKGSDALPAAAAGVAGAEFLGFVPDLDALYARSRVVCCPIMTGGGTRLKLVEAASYARPIVSTRIGAEGLDLRDGQQALLRDDDASFAAACVTLLRDDALCLRLGAAGREVMRASYDAAEVENRIVRMVEAIC